MESTGISPTLSLDGACHDAVAGSAPVLTSKHLLLIVAAEGRRNLKAELEALGATVEALSAYRYTYEFAHLNEGLPEMIVLPSSSAARLVLAWEAGTSLTGIPMLAMGPATEAAARRHGAIDVTQCPADNVESLVSSAIEFLGRHPLSDRETLHRADGLRASRIGERISVRMAARCLRGDNAPPRHPIVQVRSGSSRYACEDLVRRTCGRFRWLLSTVELYRHRRSRTTEKDSRSCRSGTVACCPELPSRTTRTISLVQARRNSRCTP